MKYKSIFIIMSLVIVSGLVIFSLQLRKKPVPCAQIKETDLFSVSTPNEMETWFEINTQLTRDDVLITPVEGTTKLRWQENGSTYYAYFYDNQLKSVHIYWETIEPTLNDVLNCFGTPDLYYAEYSSQRTGTLHLSLWYLSEGFLITSTHFGRQKKPAVIDENSIMKNIYFVATTPDTVEEMNEDLKPAIYVHYPLDVLKSWPGNLEDIVVADQTQSVD